MKKFRSALIIFSSIIILFHLIIIDYSDLSWSNNGGSYLGTLSMIFIIISMVLSNRYEKKNKK